MLPILRVLPAGGVFLAIVLMVLALKAPERTHVAFAPRLSQMRGPLIALDEHPEWRQFIIQAAIRRADELRRLRDLPNSARAAPATPALRIARLPAERIDADPDPDDMTGSIVQQQPSTIPIDIGEASSIELPVVMPEERPPVITPARLKSGHQSRAKSRTHRARVAKPKPQFIFDPFRGLFGDPKGQPIFGANTASP